jgi:putative ABC transport system permease protein
MMRMFGVFSILAIFIGCLGLFGLASFMAEQRTKEIGIRKVFGASIQKIIFLLSRDFSKWVLLGNILAWPVSYLTMKGWLENFAYRIPIGIHVFIFSALLTLIIALITVSYQSIKAAYTHPIDSLRYE